MTLLALAVSVESATSAFATLGGMIALFLVVCLCEGRVFVLVFGVLKSKVDG
jgi:hypothetical protein